VAAFTGLGGSFPAVWVATFTGIRNSLMLPPPVKAPSHSHLYTESVPQDAKSPVVSRADAYQALYLNLFAVQLTPF
jgi:hypothetical protein